MTSSDRDGGAEIRDLEERVAVLSNLMAKAVNRSAEHRADGLRDELRECQPLFPDDTKPTVLRELVARVEEGTPALAALIVATNKARFALEAARKGVDALEQVALRPSAPPSATPVVVATEQEKPRNSCNRHGDCATARANAERRGVNVYAGFCCHDECCEECFGS